MAVDWTRFAHGDKNVVEDAQRLAFALAKTETVERTRRPAPRVAEARPRRRGVGGIVERAIEQVERAAPVLGARRHRTEIFGAGLLLVDGEPRPAVLADERVTEARSGEVRPIEEEPRVLGHCRRARGIDEPPASTVVLALPPPEPQFAPHGVVHGPGTSGTCGVCVTTADGRAAILTAGHVASTGDVVHDDLSRPGDVVFSVAPTRAQQGEITADVAVVVPHVDTALACSAVTGTTDAQGGAQVTMTGAVSGARTAQIMGVMPFVFTPNMPGQWADTYLTTAGFSAAGDSGAPVLLDDGAGGQLVGHLVGASGAITSFVQDVDIQLSACRCRLRLDS